MHLRDLLPRRSPAAAPAVVDCPHLEPGEDPDPDGCVLCVLDDLLGSGRDHPRDASVPRDASGRTG
jgi:hypothetical protein